ncbi:MAG: hypothetical protein ABL951_04145 [Alphaproteobacteria bacterium]
MKIHYGDRLQKAVEKREHTVTDFARMMDYAERGSVYDLYKKEWFKPDILSKCLEVLKMTEEEFLGTESVANEPAPIYGKHKLYLEQRIEMLEETVDELKRALKQMKKQTA